MDKEIKEIFDKASCKVEHKDKHRRKATRCVYCGGVYTNCGCIECGR